MIEQTKWFERKFDFNLSAGLYPCILERFRGTPARLDEMLRTFPRQILTTRWQGGWSIQEHAGHLTDLENIGEIRLAEFLSKANRLSPADIENKRTFAANHNAKPVEQILREFRIARFSLVAKLDKLSDDQVLHTALHPRLNTPMRLVDWVFFMCEHDDHHLARMREIARNVQS
jgi:hypothetical protein